MTYRTKIENSKIFVLLMGDEHSLPFALSIPIPKAI